MPEWLSRQKRIIGRVITRKHLPAFTYRLDSRSPAAIRAMGFQPWHAAGTITLVEHVKNSYATGRPKAGLQTKDDSQWVSTGAYGLLKRLDPVFAQQILNTNIYKIDTSLAIVTGDFFDANDSFDRAGLHRPYATQREWIKLGGIPQDAVVQYMAGKDFFNQYDFKIGAPDEDALQGWLAF